MAKAEKKNSHATIVKTLFCRCRLHVIIYCVIAVVAVGIVAVLGFEKKEIALYVNDIPVERAVYDVYVQGLEKFYEKQGGITDVALPERDSIEKEAAERLIRRVITQIIAADYGIVVTPEEVNAEYQDVVNLQGSEEEVTAFLLDWYGWTPSQYKDLYIYPLVLSDKLTAALDTFPQNTQIVNLMNEVEEKLTSGKDNFEHLAFEYSQDQFAQNDGVVGYVPRNRFPREIADQLMVLEIGGVTGILDFGDSIQIIKLLDKDESQGLLKVARIYYPLYTLEEEITKRRQEATIVSKIEGLSL